MTNFDLRVDIRLATYALGRDPYAIKFPRDKPGLESMLRELRAERRAEQPMTYERKTTANDIFYAILQGDFRKATSNEQQGFGGREGECWIWENGDEICVADFHNYSARIEITATDAEGNMHSWLLNPFTHEFRQII
jgi:hypothetical protein